MFTEQQIDKVLARLPKSALDDHQLLAETIDTWNRIVGRALVPKDFAVKDQDLSDEVPALAYPPKNSLLTKLGFNLNNVLADIEPDLLLFRPEKLVNRHKDIMSLDIIVNQKDLWSVLFNAPRGFFLQNWADLIKKIYYIDHKVIDLLYDKKELKTLETHPIVRSAAVTEVDFDHIRTRYLFAIRSGYLALSHMYQVQSAAKKPTLRDLLLADNSSFMNTFSPFCTTEEYECFANLIKKNRLDEDDAKVFEQLADLEAVKHSSH